MDIEEQNDNPRFEALLHKFEVTFFWNSQHRIWWVRRISGDGKTVRSDPAGADSRASAEEAAARLIRRQYRNS